LDAKQKSFAFEAKIHFFLNKKCEAKFIGKILVKAKQKVLCKKN
jgi:hypothetical protein